MVFNINPAGGGGSADKISVTDETSAALGLEAGAMVDAALKAGGCIRLTAEPTAETVAPGGAGQLGYYDGTLYFCTAVIEGMYLWQKILKAKAKITPITEVITSTKAWTVPASVDGQYHVTVCGAGGSGGTGNEESDYATYVCYFGGNGGDAGEMQTGIFSLNQGEVIQITIGSGGAAVSGNAVSGNSGGATSFGSLLSASGGAGGAGRRAGALGSGVYDAGSGGKGLCGALGGTAGNTGSNGVNTVGLGIYSEGEGKGGGAHGSALWYGGGGGGGYGGTGGHGGGGSNGSSYGGGGGGGGYGAVGTGGTGDYTNDGSNNGGYAAGGGGIAQVYQVSGAGGGGICIITYNQITIET